MEAFSTVGEALLRAHKYHHAKSCQDLLCDIERRFRAISRWEPGVWRGFAIRANDEQHRGIHSSMASMARLLRLPLATLTFLVFFYSTTLLTSYFYPLD